MPDPIPVPNNAEIDAALKEFETSKYNTEQSPQATPVAVITPVVKIAEIPKDNNEDGVSFDTDTFKAVSARAVSAYKEKVTPGMVKLVMKLSGGAIKEKQAQWVLMGIIVVAVGISLYLMLGVASTPARNKSASTDTTPATVPAP